MTLRKAIIRLAHAKPELQQHLLPLLKASAERLPYLPGWGLLPFRMVQKAFDKLPEDPIKSRMVEELHQMQVAAEKFYKRGEKFKPQVQNILSSATTLRHLAGRLGDSPEKKEIQDMLERILKEHRPIADSLR